MDGDRPVLVPVSLTPARRLADLLHRRGTYKDLPVSRVRVDVVVFSIPRVAGFRGLFDEVHDGFFCRAVIPRSKQILGQHSPRIGIRQIFEIAISWRENLSFVIFSGGPTL